MSGDLPQFDNSGNDFDYTVASEVPVPGYTASDPAKNDGVWEITNELDPVLVPVTITKDVPGDLLEEWGDYDFEFRIDFTENGNYEEGMEIANTKNDVAGEPIEIQADENGDLFAQFTLRHSDIIMLEIDNSAKFRVVEELDADMLRIFSPVFSVDGAAGLEGNSTPVLSLEDKEEMLINVLNNAAIPEEEVVNTRLLVQKMVSSDNEDDLNKDYSFQLQAVGEEFTYVLKDEAGNIIPNFDEDGEEILRVLNSDNEFTFALKNGQSVEIAGVTETYTIVETDDGGATSTTITGTQTNGENVSISGTEVTADIGDEEDIHDYDFTNVFEAIVPDTTLTINKTVLSEDDADFENEYSFELSGVEGMYSYTKFDADGEVIGSDVLGEDGDYTFTLKHGESIVISGLTGDYVVTETDAHGADVSVSGTGLDGNVEQDSVEGSIEENDNHAYNFINDFIGDPVDPPNPPVDPILNNLTITKLVANSNATDSFKLNFVINGIADGSYILRSSIRPDETVNVVNGQFSYTIRANETITILGVPAAARVTVTEELSDTQASQIELTQVSADGGAYEDSHSITVEMDDDRAITFLNHYADENVPTPEQPETPTNPGQPSLPGVVNPPAVDVDANRLPQTDEDDERMLMIFGGIIVAAVVLGAAAMYTKRVKAKRNKI